MQLALQTLRTIIALGYQVMMVMMMVMMVMVMMVMVMVMMVMMVAEHLATVLGDQHQVWAVDGQGLRQRHLARPFSLCKLLFFVLTLVVLVADETVPQKLFVGRAFVFRLAIFFK